MKPLIGKLLYALAFCGALPALLFLWARALDGKYPGLPPVAGGSAAGLALVAAGGGLMLRAMWELWHVGGGLPMNAYPPERHVARGLYGWLPHPIYVGFALLMLGGFTLARMPGGVWLVSPVLWLGTVALVVGFERREIQRRFGPDLPPPRLALPANSAAAPRWWQIAAGFVLLLGPWVAGYEGIARLLHGRPGTETYLPVEHTWPVLAWTVLPYTATYLWVVLAPLAATSQAALRRFIREGWVGAAGIFWWFLVFPLAATPRPFTPDAFLGGMLQFTRDHDTAFCAFPSFHVFWPLLAARLWAQRMPSAVAYGLAALMGLSCVTTGMHSLADVLAGAGVFAAVSRMDALWRALLRVTEKVANSWRDWRFGPVRIINHGGYVALAAGAGVWLVGWLLGPACTPAIVLVALSALLGAGIWAQLLESSSGLSRPFGYYGSIFGGILGVIAVQLWRGEGWLLLAAFFTAAPVIQATGRLRCLVQGCCHGRPGPAELGIRYTHPLSRVCKLANWAGVPVHPTPLYSIAGNFVIGGLLLRLWFSGADLGFISGSYLILSAGARFMEEGYRGEPQTARFGGLAIYQWLALLFVLGGAVCTVLPGPVPPPTVGGAGQPLFFAVPFGLLVWFAMGVDFPESNRRFSRLA